MLLGRTIITGFAACVAVFGSSGDASVRAASQPPPIRVINRGVTTLPLSVTGRDGSQVPITGLSGITWLGDDRYAAIMDNSDKLLTFTLPIGPDGEPGEPGDFEVITLAERHDYEDIAVCPPPLQERITARQLRKGLPDPGRCLLVAEEDTPAIRVAALADGSLLGVIPIPSAFSARRPNRGLESLDVDPDGRHIWTANEEALPADGPAAAVGVGTVVRLTRIAIPEPGSPDRPQPVQIAYAIDPPHEFIRMFPGDPLSGVAALTGLGNGRLLVLERSGCPGLPPFENRLYLVDTQGAPDVSNVEHDLAEHEHAGEGEEARQPKALLWKDQLGCNVEGLCLGKALGGGGRSLVAIADNNGIGTPNQVIGFVLEVPPAGMPLPLVVGGAALVAAVFGTILLRWLLHSL